MKAFLLAAGEGTRLRPITDRLPKCLVPIRGVPMLEIWLRRCQANGIDQVLINLHTHAGSVREFLQGADFGIEIQIAEEPKLLGSAGTLRANQAWVKGEDFFWIFYADVLTLANLRAMETLHQRRKLAATLGVYHVPDPQRCGIVSIDKDSVIECFTEKPKEPIGDLAFSGLMIATPELLNAIPDRNPVDIGFDVLPALAGRMTAFTIQEYLLDIGTIENYQRAQQTWPGLDIP